MAQANLRGLPLVLVGDIFHLPRVATEVVNMAIGELRAAFEPVYLLAGNHDLPFHAYEHADKCSFGTLAHVFPELQGEHGPQGVDAAPFGLDKQGTAPIRFIHRLIFPDAKARPFGVEVGQTAEELLAEFPDNKWIFTGDYHLAFHFEMDGRHVVNPGALNVQAADMIDYSPRIAVVDTDAGLVEWVEIPQAESITTDVYLQETAAKDERLGAFLDAVAAGGAVSLSFRDNLEAKLAKGLDALGAKADPRAVAMVPAIVTQILQECKNEK